MTILPLFKLTLVITYFAVLKCFSLTHFLKFMKYILEHIFQNRVKYSERMFSKTRFSEEIMKNFHYSHSCARFSRIAMLVAKDTHIHD